MLNINSPLMAEFADKAYRDAYVGSQIRMTLPLQIRGLREGFGWKQSKLASEAHMAQPRISELETPGERRLTIETLLRVASAFDIALQVRFLSFSELVEWNENLDLNNVRIKTFLEEVQESHKAIGRRRRLGIRTTGNPSSQLNLFESQVGSAKTIVLEMPKQGDAAAAKFFTRKSGQSAEGDSGLVAVAGNKATGAVARRFAYGH